MGLIKKEINLNKNLKIVVIKTDGIGDAILATPFLFELRKIFKKAHITGILSPQGKEVLDLLNIFDEIKVIEPKWLGYKKVSFLIRWLYALKLLFLINKVKADIAFALRWQDRITSFILSVCNAKKKVGYDVKGMGFRIDLKAKNENIHTIYKNLNLLKLIQPEMKYKIKLGFSVSEEAENSIKKFLIKNKIKNYIVIHPVSGHPSKDWGIDNFFLLAERLSKKYKILIIGAKTDKNIEKIRGKNILNVAGTFSIKETGCLIKNSLMVIGGDSSAGHIAAVFKKKSLILFSGAALFENWAPFNKNCFIVTRNVKCRGCELINCNKNHDCMNFKDDFIFDLVKKILSGKQKNKIIKV